MAANKRQQNAPEQPKKRGIFSLILMPVGIVFTIFYYLLASIILGTALEWGGMVLGFFPYDHAAQTLIAEFDYLGSNFTRTLTGLSAEETGLRVVRFFEQWLIPVTQTPRPDSELMIAERFWQDVTTNWPYYRNSFFYVVMITGIRFVIIALSSVLFVLVGIAAAVDGLHLRELRKLSGGIEHASIYHHAKAMVPVTVFVAPVLYLACPWSINPNFILLPGMLAFFLAVLVTFSTFKKYL